MRPADLPSPFRAGPALAGLRPFVRPYRWRIAWALLCLLLAAGAALLLPLALRQLIDLGLSAALTAQRQARLQQDFLALLGVATAMGVFSALRYHQVSWLGERITADVRQAVYAHVLQQSPAFFERTATGEVLSRLTADATLVQTVVGSSLSLGLRSAVMGLGALGLLIWQHPLLMLPVLLGLLLVVAPSVWFGRRVRRLSRASQDRVADASAVAAEVLNATALVQSYTAEAREAERFRQASQVAFDTAVKRTRARAILMAFIIFATSAALLWGLYQGTQAVLAGRMSAGALGQTIVYVIMLASASAMLGEVFGDIQRAAGATERLMELLHSPIALLSPAKPLALPADGPPGSPVLECRDLNFHYPSKPQVKALSQFNLQLAPGETVALVGASGAGKTTLFQLLLRLYEPQSGEIRLRGLPTRDLRLQDLRASMALVAQESVIFATSVLENIRYGRPEASLAQVQAAAKAAFAHDFIMELAQGYDSFLGERGVRLSGGQRQRLAIARAILKDAPILLLDEATSALDAHSERAVQAALEAAMHSQDQRRATLVIAHRLATVQRATRIVVLERGRIVEQGTHSALLQAGGVYARLAALQFQS